MQACALIPALAIPFNWNFIETHACEMVPIGLTGQSQRGAHLVAEGSGSCLIPSILAHVGNFSDDDDDHPHKSQTPGFYEGLRTYLTRTTAEHLLFCFQSWRMDSAP